MNKQFHAAATQAKRAIWKDYYGFTDKLLEYFMKVQDELLMKQIGYIRASGLWERIVGNLCPLSPEEFRNAVPLTTYEDYRDIFMNKDEALLPGKVKVWAQTTGSTGNVKLIPYTEEFYGPHGEFLIQAAVLSSEATKASLFKPDNIFFCTVAPPPYASGLGVKAALEILGLIAFPPFEEAEEMSFTGRIVRGFMMALDAGRIDAIGGVASVLVSIGKMFEASLGSYLESDRPTPSGKRRILRKYLDAKREGRILLPKDIFNPKVILCIGADTSLLADSVEEYWGKRPAECYAMTEAGTFAVQPFGCSDMVFMPNVAYLEFIPEDKYNEDQPSTHLINELKVAQKYEPVITSFHGGCMLRYRSGDLVEVVALEDSPARIQVPLIRFYSRADDVINLSGLVRLNEKACWRIVEEAGINYNDWFVTKEVRGEKVFLHFHIETFESRRRVLNRLRKSAANTIATFREVPEVLGHNPLDVTILKEGTFSRYRSEVEAEGVELGKIKPVRINPAFDRLNKIKRIDRELRGNR